MGSPFIAFCVFVVMAYAIFRLAGSLSFRFIPSDALAALTDERAVPKTLKAGVLRAAMTFILMTSVLATIVLLLKYDLGASAFKGAIFGMVGLMLFILLKPVVSAVRASPLLKNVLRSGSATALVMLAAFVPNWVTTNALVLAMSLAVLMVCREFPTKLILAMFAGVMVYDLVAVFGTGQMITLATKSSAMDLPLMFQVPSGFALDAPPVSVLGLGDVVFPGMLVMVAMRESRRLGQPMLRKMTMLGYAIGLACAYIALATSEFPQPALIYLLPSTVGALLLTASFTGTLKEVLDSPKRTGPETKRTGV